MKNRLFMYGFALLLGCAWTVQATDIDWNNTTGGDFSDGNNWSGGIVPVYTNNARFLGNAGGTYTVTFTEPETTVRQIRVGNSPTKDITFDLGGNTLIATNLPPVAHDGAIDIRATVATGDMLLRITNGLFKAIGHLAIGERGSPPATNGAQLVVGPNATFQSFESIRIGDRVAQKGVIRIENGGKWMCSISNSGSSHWLIMARSTGTEGIIIVDGEGSEVDLHPTNLVAGAVSPAVFVGYGSTGTVHVLNGGRLSGAGLTRLGGWSSDQTNALGVLHVQDPGSEFRSSDIRVGSVGSGRLEVWDGGHVFSGGSITIADGIEGQAVVRDGGSLEAANVFYTYSGGTLAINGGTAVATNICRFFSGSTYQLTIHSPVDTPLRCGTNFQIDANAELDVRIPDDFNAFKGDQFVVSQYGGSLLGVGAFDGLPQDAEITVGDYTFQIDYGSGSDSQITLEVTAAPSQGTLILIH